METPDTNKGGRVVASIRAALGTFEDTNDNGDPLPKCQKYLKFTPQKLSQLILACAPQPHLFNPFHRHHASKWRRLCYKENATVYSFPCSLNW